MRRIFTCQIDQFCICIHQTKKQNKRDVVLFCFVAVEGIIWRKPSFICPYLLPSQSINKCEGEQTDITRDICLTEGLTWLGKVKIIWCFVASFGWGGAGAGGQQTDCSAGHTVSVARERFTEAITESRQAVKLRDRKPTLFTVRGGPRLFFLRRIQGMTKKVLSAFFYLQANMG